MSDARVLLVTAPTEQEPMDGRGFHDVDPDAPHLRVTDLGATRGDGVFETIGVIDGHPQSLTPHLERLAASAAILDLPRPRLDVWYAAVQAVLAAVDPAPELSVKLVLTRGEEGARRCTGWVRAAPAPDMSDARTRGVAVLTLDRGYRADIAETAPWLLQGAKYTSYAVNMAALRHARRSGAEDVIFVSSDGAVLEGPTASVVLRLGDELITPGTDQSILPGTTQDRVFRCASQAGLSTRARRVQAHELTETDHIWLVSSVRLCAPVRSLDGRDLRMDRELTAQMLMWLQRTHD
ncbi:aminodeoxychorismate lyase [Ruania halotolerans]|uniref:aminodeoxychorismate lyase n=1 Tax=Ruania halotolerans TaxID=2897773 RepID=UPI001E496D63|nr:aminodeoxychorismate lyase [Ruania halotolerans]UFU04784.1 aminodeoxychorismate lyase [Ruania halotolerans]